MHRSNLDEYHVGWHLLKQHLRRWCWRKDGEDSSVPKQKKETQKPPVTCDLKTELKSLARPLKHHFQPPIYGWISIIIFILGSVAFLSFPNFWTLKSISALSFAPISQFLQTLRAPSKSRGVAPTWGITGYGIEPPAGYSKKQGLYLWLIDWVLPKHCFTVGSARKEVKFQGWTACPKR